MAFIYAKVSFIVVSTILTIASSVPTHENPTAAVDKSNNKQLFAYSYSVNSPSNGDIKSHSESRNGKTVTGEYSIVQPDGCIRHVRYMAGVDGFVPEIHYEGNCNLNNFAVSSENMGPTDTYYIAPLTAIKTESRESHKTSSKTPPSKLKTRKFPSAIFRRPLKSYQAFSNINKAPQKAHKVRLNAHTGQLPDSHAPESPSGTSKTFSHFSQTDYDYDDYDYEDYDYDGYEYDGHARPPFVIVINSRSKLNSSHLTPSGTNNFSQGGILTAAVASESVVDGVEPRNGQLHSVVSNVSASNYAHVHSTFTIPHSHHYQKTKIDSGASKTPHKYQVLTAHY